MAESLAVYLVKIVLATFAVYRVAFEIAARMGPFDVFYRFRTWATLTGKMWLEEWATCAACQGFWLAFVATLVFFPGLSISWFVLTWLAVSGAVTVVHFSLIGLKG